MSFSVFSAGSSAAGERRFLSSPAGERQSLNPPMRQQAVDNPEGYNKNQHHYIETGHQPPDRGRQLCLPGDGKNARGNQEKEEETERVAGGGVTGVARDKAEDGACHAAAGTGDARQCCERTEDGDGAHDPVGGHGKGVKQVYGWLAKTGHSAELKLYENGRHEMLNEINRKDVYGDILLFINTVEAMGEVQ